MKILSKIKMVGLTVFMVFWCSVFALPVTANAITNPNPLQPGCSANSNAANSDICKADGSDPITGQDGIVLKVTKLVALVAGIASIFMIMLGGFTYIKSDGDAQQIKAAKDTILYAIIGLVVATLAPFIVAFVVQKIL